MSRTLKRTLAAVLSIVLILGCFFTIPFTASAATKKTLVLKATPEYKAGKVTGIVLTLNAKDCVGFKHGKFTITYDKNVLKYDQYDHGKDAAEVNDKCNPEKNSFMDVVNSSTAGSIKYGCLFLEKLMSKADFQKCLKRSASSIDVNTTNFELAKFYFSVKDTTAKSTSFKFSTTSSTYDFVGCTVSLVCSHPSYATTVKTATTSAAGKKVTACKTCGYVKSSSKIAKINASSIKLSVSSTTYTGAKKKPSVTVKDTAGKTLVQGTDYTVVYSNNTAVGKASVKITFKGNYSGSKTLSFTIKPANVTGLTAKQTLSTITLSWNKVAGAAGYRIYKYNATTKKYTQIGQTTATTYKISKLSKGTVYSYYVKAYKKGTNGTTYTSPDYIKIKTATKTSAPAAPVLKAGTGKITAKWAAVKGATGYQFAYATSANGTYKKISTVKLTCTKTGLTKGQTYFVKIRTYKTVDGKKIYSAYSPYGKVTVK